MVTDSREAISLGCRLFIAATLMATFLAPPASAAGANGVTETIEAAMSARDYPTAVRLCEAELARLHVATTQPDDGLRRICAQGLVALGDRLATKGTTDAMMQARSRWRQALILLPSVDSDGTLQSRLAASPSTDDPLDGLAWPEPEVTGATKNGDSDALDHIAWPEPGQPRTAPEASVPPPAQEVPPPPKRPEGARAGRLPGVGISAGFDGLMAGVVSYMWDEMIAIDVSVGLLFPTLDVRFRYYGMRDMVSPVVGVGVTVPFGRDARFDLDVPEYADLYRLGETFHVDIGIGIAPDPHVEIFAGVALVTTLDQETLDRLILFPQVAAQVIAYF
jgi:hypothetical protein